MAPSVCCVPFFQKLQDMTPPYDDASPSTLGPLVSETDATVRHTNGSVLASYQNGAILPGGTSDEVPTRSSSRCDGASCRWIVRIMGLFTVASLLALIKVPLSPDHGISVSSSSESVDLHKRYAPFFADVVDALHRLDSQIEGNIYMFDQRGFESAATVWNNLANDNSPFAVIQVKNEQDVQHVLPALRQLNEQFGIPFRIRSGGHHKAGYSSVKDGIVVSMVRMNGIQLDISTNNSATAIATFEPAVLVKDVLTKVLKPFGYAGVIGICGDVAESGYLLGGGQGFQSRFRGLGIDHVIGMRVVLADGSALYVDEHHHSDLFWALRGAGGGSFGVVTQLQVQFYQAHDTQLITNITVSYDDLPLMMQRMGELTANFQFPGEIGFFLGQITPDVSEIAVFFFWFGLVPSKDTNQVQLASHQFKTSLLDVFGEITPRHNWTIIPMSWAGTVQFNPKSKEVSLVEPPWLKPYVQAWTGFLFPENNTLAIWNDIISQMSSIFQECSYLQPHTELWGGAISQVASNATAFYHRGGIYNFGVMLYVPSFQNPNALQIFEEQKAKVNAWWPNVSQYLTGVYNNYPMPSLTREEYPRAYWGENVKRLVRIKQKYDPTNVFQFEQSVPIQL